MPYHAFPLARLTAFDPIALVPALRTLVGDVTTGYSVSASNTVTVKKAVAWTAPQIAAVQTLLDTAPAFDPVTAEVDSKILTAIVLGVWECIPAPSLTKAQLRNRILAIRSGL